MLFEARRALEHAAAEPPVWEDGYDVLAARAEAPRPPSPSAARRSLRSSTSTQTGAVPPLPARGDDVTLAEGLVLHLHGMPLRLPRLGGPRRVGPPAGQPQRTARAQRRLPQATRAPLPGRA